MKFLQKKTISNKNSIKFRNIRNQMIFKETNYLRKTTNLFYLFLKFYIRSYFEANLETLLKFIKLCSVSVASKPFQQI